MFELLFSSGLIATLCDRSNLTDHGVKLHDVPDEYLVDTLTIAKKIAIAQGTENYNILQVWSHFSLTSPLRHLFNRLFDNPTTLEQRTHRAPGTMCLTCTKLSSGLVPLITRHSAQSLWITSISTSSLSRPNQKRRDSASSGLIRRHRRRSSPPSMPS